MGIEWTPEQKKSQGGTELMMRGLEERINPSLLDQFQIISSRKRTPLNRSKKRILWCHDTSSDPEVSFLANGGWNDFHKIVFVSHHQQFDYQLRFGIPPSRCQVMPNAIVPLADHIKPSDGPIRLIYTPTPHRGLDILAAVFDRLVKDGEDIVLDVYSSFRLYGWEQKDEQFSGLFEFLKTHDKINYHGTVDNQELRDALKRSHIFAYPSTWQETSCLCLMEAMSAGLVSVHSNLGALYETASNFTIMYPYHEDKTIHASRFYAAMKAGIEEAKRLREHNITPSDMSSKMFADASFDWEMRADQWRVFLEGVLSEPEPADPNEEFVYSTN